MIAKVQGLFSALWLFGISATFFITWFRPDALGDGMIVRLMFVMIIEFFVVHATGFYGGVSFAEGPRWKRAGMYLGLAAFYLLFGLAFSAAYGGLFPFYAMLALLAPKVAGILSQPVTDSGTQMMIMANWGAMVAMYLFAIFATLIVPVPSFGITPEVIAALELDMTGEWPEHPYKVIAAGAIYFAGLGVLAIVMPFVSLPKGPGEAHLADRSPGGTAGSA